MTNQEKFDRYARTVANYLNNGLISSYKYRELMARARRLYA